MHITCNWQRKLKMTPTFYFGPVDSHTPMKTGHRRNRRKMLQERQALGNILGISTGSENSGLR